MNTGYYDTFNEHLLHDEKPSLYFTNLMNAGEFPIEFPFNMLMQLKNTPQNPKYHPEGNAFNHTMQVVDQAAILNKSSKEPAIFMWTALLHDIGKGPTTQMRKGKITSYNHETEGAVMDENFLTYFHQPNDFIQSVCKMIKWHMQPLFLSKNLPFSKLDAMIKEVSVSELGLFSLCDRLGRAPMSRVRQEEEYRDILSFFEKCLPKVKDSYEQKRINELSYYMKRDVS